MKKFVVLAAVLVAALSSVSSAEARSRFYNSDQARAAGAVAFLTSTYPDWAKAAFGGGEGAGGEGGGGGCP